VVTGFSDVFRHFPTKEAILVDHLATRREGTIQRLRDRPPGEPPLVGLHAVLRELAEEGYDRRLLAQIRDVLRTDPRLGSDELSIGTLQFEKKIAEALQHRIGETRSALESKR
jgi:AcrR family transcriptional regulator